MGSPGIARTVSMSNADVPWGRDVDTHTSNSISKRVNPPYLKSSDAAEPCIVAVAAAMLHKVTDVSGRGDGEGTRL